MFFSPSVSWSAEIDSSLQEKELQHIWPHRETLQDKKPPNTMSAGTSPQSVPLEWQGMHMPAKFSSEAISRSLTDESMRGRNLTGEAV